MHLYQSNFQLAVFSVLKHTLTHTNNLSVVVCTFMCMCVYAHARVCKNMYMIMCVSQ